MLGFCGNACGVHLCLLKALAIGWLGYWFRFGAACLFYAEPEEPDDDRIMTRLNRIAFHR